MNKTTSPRFMASFLMLLLAAFAAIGQYAIDFPARTAAVILCALALTAVVSAIAFGVAHYPEALVIGAIAEVGILTIIMAGS